MQPLEASLRDRLIDLAKRHALRLIASGNASTKRVGVWFVRLIESDMPPMSDTFMTRALSPHYDNSSVRSAITLFHKLSHYAEGYRAAKDGVA